MSGLQKNRPWQRANGVQLDCRKKKAAIERKRLGNGAKSAKKGVGAKARLRERFGESRQKNVMGLKRGTDWAHRVYLRLSPSSCGPAERNTAVVRR